MLPCETTQRRGLGASVFSRKMSPTRALRVRPADQPIAPLPGPDVWPPRSSHGAFVRAVQAHVGLLVVTMQFPDPPVKMITELGGLSVYEQAMVVVVGGRVVLVVVLVV